MGNEINAVNNFAVNGQRILDQARQSLENAGIKVDQSEPLFRFEDKNDAEQPIAGAELERTTKPEVDRKLDTKEEREAAVKETKEQFLKYGRSDGTEVTDEKEAEKLAKLHVKNQQYKEEFDAAAQEKIVFADKDAYKKFKKETKEHKKELIDQYRAEGLSKKEAKKRAEAETANFELAARSARKGFAKLGLVESDGTLGQKARDYMLEQANIGNNVEGEETSYHYELKERRATQAIERARGNRLTLHALGKMADAVDLHKEKNYTGVMRLATAGAIIGAGVLSGGITSASASVATAAANSATPYSGSSASAIGAGAARAHIGGGLIGAALSPLAFLVKDPGKKVVHSFAPAKPEPVQPVQPSEPVQPTQPVQPEQPVQPIQPEECPEELAYCEHKVVKGDDWTRVAQGKVTIDGKKIDGKLLRAYVHAQKLQHGVTDFKKNTFMKQGEAYRLYERFDNLFADEEIMKKYPELALLKGKEIKVDCDADYKHGKITRPSNPFAKYTGNPIKIVTDCYGNYKVVQE